MALPPLPAPAPSPIRRAHVPRPPTPPPAQKTSIKKNLRKFSGFAGSKEAKEAEVKKKTEPLKKVDAKMVKKLCEICDLPTSGSKVDTIERVLAFLSSPEASGKPPLSEKVGEKRGRPAGAAGKKASPAAKKGKKETKGKKEKVPRAKTAYQLYSNSRCGHMWGAGVGLYAIFFYFYSFLHESIVLSFSRRACIAHTVATLLHGSWAIYDPPSTSVLYAIHHITLVITISCKGQRGRGSLLRTRGSGAKARRST